jgi:hypothetical protein
MLTARRVAFILGGGFLCSLAFRFLSFPLRETLPFALLALLQLGAAVGGGFYGNAQWRKQTPGSA